MKKKILCARIRQVPRRDAPYKLQIQVRPLVSWQGLVQNKTEHGDWAAEVARCRCVHSDGGWPRVGIRFWTAWSRKPFASATWVEGEGIKAGNVSEAGVIRERVGVSRRVWLSLFPG